MTIQDALKSLHDTIVFGARDWSEDERLAWIYGIVVGWENDNPDSTENAMAELVTKFRWDNETVTRLRSLHKVITEIDDPELPDLLVEERQIALHEAAGTVCWMCRNKEYPLHANRGDSHYWIHSDDAECGASAIHDLISKAGIR
jgi:hypothetical protein